jgi:hypothetical protein
MARPIMANILSSMFEVSLNRSLRLERRRLCEACCSPRGTRQELRIEKGDRCCGDLRTLKDTSTGDITE